MLPDRLAGALARLSAALHRLQATAAQRAQADAANSDREQEFALLQDDRNRLAADLDAALARQERLVAAQDEAMQRLDGAGRTVEAVMAGIARPAGEVHAMQPGEMR